MNEEQLIQEFLKIRERISEEQQRSFADFAVRIRSIHDYKKIVSDLVFLLRELKEKEILLARKKVRDTSGNSAKETAELKNEIEAVRKSALQAIDSLKKRFFALHLKKEEFEDGNLLKALEEHEERIYRQIKSFEIEDFRELSSALKAGKIEGMSAKKRINEILQDIAKELNIGRKELGEDRDKIFKKINEMLDRHSENRKKQKRALLYELRELEQIESMLKQEQIESLTQLDGFIRSLTKNLKENLLEVLLRQEKTILDTYLRPLFKSQEKLWKKFAEQRLSARKIRKKDILRDIRAFTDPSELIRYKEALMKTPGLLEPDALRILEKATVVGLSETERQRRLKMEELEEKAFRDPLTGLFSKRAYIELAGKYFGEAKREEKPLSLAILDIDYFKKVNDTYGHHIGNEILALLGEVIRKQLRKKDFASKYGGEEFVIILPETTVEQAITICNRIREEFIRQSEAKMLKLVKVPKGITLSAGIATFPYHAETADELFIKADKALYSAKNTGRNRIVAFHEAL